MADLSYQVAVDTQQAQQSLTRLQNNIKSVNDTFASLNRAIAGLAIGAFTANAVRMAAALDDVASASGIALANVVGFSQAVAANGGTVEAAGTAIARFSNFVEAAANGNKEAQSTFLRLGVTMNDLRTLSEQDLLRKTIAGLGSMDVGARRTAVSMDIFGKSFASVDVGGLNRQLDGFISRAGPTAAALRSAADAEQNFANAIQRLQVEVLAALEPISRLANSLLENTEAVAQFIRAVVSGLAIAGVTALVIKLGAAVVSLGAAFGGVIAVIRNLPNLFRAIFNPTTRSSLLQNLDELGTVGQKARVVLNAMGASVDNLIKRWPLLAAGVAGAAAAIREFFGLGAKNPGIAQAEAAIEAQKQALIAARAAQEERRRVAAAIDTETQALNKQVGAYQNNIAAAGKKYELETELVNATERRKLLVEELMQAEQAYLNTVGSLLDEYAKKSQSANEVDLQMLPRIRQALMDVTAAYQEQIGAIAANTEARARANEERALEAFRTRAQIDYENQLQRILDDIAKSSLSEIERKYYDIEAAARASAKAAIEAEQARRGAALSPEEAKAYYDAAIRGTDELKRKTRDLYEQSRTFEAGWSKAFREYADEATNAARRAEDLFKKATKGMEDAIVNFVKTGKFEWKSFVAMMLEELLRAQIQQIFAGIFGAARPPMGGGGGGGGGGGNILGNILGGILGGGGSKGGGGSGGGGGGGILGTIGKIGGGLKDIFGGGGGGGSSGGGGGGGILGTIGKIGGGILGGIKDIFGGGFGTGGGFGNEDFGGFFANGGMIPAGKFGVVGERGPEFVSGPASVTPMGGTTNVTYNIQAVDAASFQSLVARDPSFIFAVTEQGRKSFAGAR